MRTFRKLLVAALFAVLGNLPAGAQCWSGSYGGSISPSPGPAYQTMPIVTGEYYDFTVPNTCIPTYDFSFCAADGGSAFFNSQISVLNSSGTILYDFSDDFCGTQSHLTWTPPGAGTYILLVTTSWCSGGDAGILAFRAVPPPPTTFVSCTATQASTSPVTLCDTDQEILRIEVVLSNTMLCGNITLDQFMINMNGSTIPGTNANDVNGMHIYYTGNSPVMMPINEFIPGGFNPAPGTMTLNGSQPLLAGANYFWLCYDVCTANGTTGNLLDGQCVQLTVNGIPHVPAVTAPAGSRTITNCAPYPATTGPNFKLWLNASAGITLSGTQVTQWNDLSGAGVTGNFVVQSAPPWITPQTEPTYSPGLLNGNPGVAFDGVSNSLASLNQFAGNSLFDPNNNTIVSVVNQISGTVWYKWEDNPWTEYRVGYETNGNSLRFDFYNDIVGKNDQSITSIAQNDVIVETTTDAINSVVSFNGNADGIKNISGLNFTPNPANLFPLAIGNNELSIWEYPARINIFELLQFSKKLQPGEMRMVDSYLGIKYGITIGNNRNAGNCMTYLASDGTPVWSNKTGYHNYVIGIGRDDLSTLNQLLSKSTPSMNGSTDILTIANGTNFAAPSAFGTNKSFFVCGTNKLQLMSTALSITDVPPGIVSRLERVWQGQETGNVGTITLEFDMSSVPGPNNLNDVRLLVSQAGIFAPPATVIVSPSFVSGTTVRFQHNFTAATGFYFTVGSVNWNTAPLPVSLVSFDASCNGKWIELDWITASETNNDYFTISRSVAGGTPETIATITGAGSSSQSHVYQYRDESIHNQQVYYILSQTDFNGDSETLSTIAAPSCTGDDYMMITPNPNPGNFSIQVFGDEEESVQLDLFNPLGQLVVSETIAPGDPDRVRTHSFDLTGYPPGIFLLRARTRYVSESFKIIIDRK